RNSARSGRTLIRVIDIKTTGTDPACDAIIEIASVDMVRGGSVTNAMDTLIRPTKPIPSGASALHHLIDEDVQSAPLLAGVIERFKSADVYVATNARSRSGPNSTATAISNCGMRWEGLRPSVGTNAVPSLVVTAAIFEELINRARWR